MRFETLYKTEHPERLNFAEYYQPQIEMELRNGKWIYFVREKHGWFNDTEKRPVHHLNTLNPEDGFESFDEAARAYERQVQHRATEGFVHSFSIEIPTGQVYRRVPPTKISG